MSTILESPSLKTRDDSRQAAHASVVALAGNPNAGKTTLFNALTGLRQKVANYPGVTVERKEGVWHLMQGAPPARLIDLPGLYSLDAASIDEQIARDVITGRISGLPAPDVIVAVVDATNLERNLYLVTQLLEYGRPLVVALTMCDLAKKRGLLVDEKRLSEALSVEVVPVTASQKRGLDELRRAVLAASARGGLAAGWCLSDEAERELAALIHPEGATQDRHTALRELYGDELPEDEKRREAIKRARERLAETDGNWWQEPLLARYDWIERVAREAKGDDEDAHAPTTTERIDRVLTHKLLGPLILILIMLLIFQAIFSWAALPMDLIDSGFDMLGDFARAQLPQGLFTDLLVDGAIAGVGGVLIFLPQILALCFFIALAEYTR